MPSSELHYATIEELCGPLQNRELSPVELVDAALKRVEQLDERLGVFITVTADQARADARAAEDAVMRGDDLGPLHGVPVSIKDLTPTAGIRTTFGSKIHEHNVPTEDALLVERMREAGATCLCLTAGKTLMFDRDEMLRLADRHRIAVVAAPPV